MLISDIIHLRNGGTSVVIDTGAPGVPAIAYWGPDLGALESEDLADLCRATLAQQVSGGLDVIPRLTLLPQEAFGWQGTPGLGGSRDGRDFSTAMRMTSIAATTTSVTIDAADQEAGLALTIELDVTAEGLLRQRLALTNTGRDAVPYTVEHLSATFPLPDTAVEILDTTGRHLRERHPQRHAFTIGQHRRESRRGRPGFDSTLLLLAGTPGFGFRSGLVHGVHLAWSGDHSIAAERGPGYTAFIEAHELLAPGEIVLAEGERYEAPVAIASWGAGLDELASRFHRNLRARPTHPSRPRPVTLNTWEAVYFDHDLERLRELATLAASVGIERFVLDDGWFRGRRDDRAGLGDWYVDETVWPDGLGPLFSHVVDLGMECGLWVEPEMVNPDSDLAREHPDWLLRARNELPLEARQQQCLDLTHPDAYAYILERLDALVTEYPLAYLKWDHNRDLLEAGSTRTGKHAVHENVLALYRLIDTLRERHPGLEIESCASGGGRVDLGILDRTDRIWTSDCIDPIERMPNQQYTGLVVPYELMGAHIGGPESHSTGRRHELDFRATTAIFGHLGVEWDITRASEDERERLASWIAVHKEWRSMLHTGTSVHADLPDPSMDLRGVVAADAASALFAFTQLTTSANYPGGMLRLPGLDDERRYSVRVLTLDGRLRGGVVDAPLAWAEQELKMSGRALRVAGVRAPVVHPEHAVVVQVVAE